MKTTSTFVIILGFVVFQTGAHADFLGDVGKALTAPVTAPAQLARDIAGGRPPNEVVQNQLNIQVGAPAVAVGSSINLIQRGNDFLMNVPRDAIQANLGGDWLRGYDILTASQRIQQEVAFTSGRFLSQCAATRQCTLNQFAAMPLAAAMRDAYKVYWGHSESLPPQLTQVLSRVVPFQVLTAARWAVGNTPDLTVPGFLNSGHSTFGTPFAVTIGNVMIFSEMPDLNTRDGYTWLLHEMFHIERKHPVRTACGSTAVQAA